MIFQSKTDDNTSMDYKPKQIRDSFEGRYVKYKSEKDKKLSITGFLKKISPHLCDMTDDYKKPVEWKIHLTMKPKFISSTVLRNVRYILRVIAA